MIDEVIRVIDEVARVIDEVARVIDDSTRPPVNSGMADVRNCVEKRRIIFY